MQITWTVTKGGIQGAYEPTGHFYPTASNNLGTVDYTVTVVKADRPGRVRWVNVTERTPQSLTFAAEPPVEDNCIPAITYQILYNRAGTNDFQENRVFELGKPTNCMCTCACMCLWMFY